MRINRRLNLTMEVKTEELGTVYVHSVPLSREAFNEHFLLVSRLFAKVYNEDLGPVAGPRVAALLLRRMAERTMETAEAEAILSEIRRLTNVAYHENGVWKTHAFQDVIDHKLIDAEVISEVENAVVFFTSASSMLPKERLSSILGLMNLLWHTQNTLSSFTEYTTSLATSMKEKASSSETTEKGQTHQDPDFTPLSQIPH
jgi:hypothetical protein